MPPAVTIVAGPANSGKTQALLARYRAALAGHLPTAQASASPIRIGQALWIAPTERAAASVRDRLVGDSLPACFAPNVMTFERFAQAILDASPELVRPLSPMSRRQLIRRIADEQHAAGKLAHFAAIAHTPGFIDLVAGFLSEFKRSEIWPEDFAAACTARGMTPKDRELHAIYEAYQAAITKQQLFDAEGRFWSARTLLESGHAGPFARLQMVVVDGFTDFSWTQLEILKLLGERLGEKLGEREGELFISLPLEQTSERRELFAKSTATLAQIRNRLPEAALRWTHRAEAAAWPVMGRLETELFGDPRRKLSPVDTTGVEILAGPGQLGELKLVADRIKALLITGEAQPQEIGVVFRSTAEVVSLVREVFTAYGIPFVIDQRPPLGTSPLLACMTQLLELEAADWPYRQTLAVLGNGYINPPPFADARPAIQVAIDRALRHLQLPSGRDKLRQRLRSLAESYAPTPERESRRSAGASAVIALPYVDHVMAALTRLPHRAPPIVWAAELDDLATSLGMLNVASQQPRGIANNAASAASVEIPNADLLAWDRFLDALRSASRLAGWLEVDELLWTRAELLDHVREVLQIEAIPLPLDETGRVRILAAQSVRALEIPHLFIANLAEQSFPRRDREDVLYHDAERARLIDAGLRLARRADRGGEEMLLFYEVVTRATRRLTLSYPAINDKAEPLLPSPYLLEVQRLVGHAASPATAADLRPLPRAAAGYTRIDARLLAMQAALDGDERRFAEMIASRGIAGTTNLVAALRTADERRKTPGYGPMEGMFASAAAKQLLAERFGSNTIWSATLLEGYGLCPMRFMLQHLLQLEAPRELALESDHLQRGGLMHAALAAAHRATNACAGGPSSPAQFTAEFNRGFAEQLAALVDQTRKDNALDAALLELDAQLLTELVDIYLGQHAAYDEKAGNLRPAHFEVAFGPQRVADPDADALSTDAPLILRLDGEELRFAGRIDRIDLEPGADGSLHFSLIDYKSGRDLSAKKLTERAESGRQIQLDLYTLAVEEVVLANRQPVAREIGYWHVQGKGYRAWQTIHESQDGSWQPTAGWAERKRRVMELVFAFVRGIRDGQFPVHSCDDECTSFCDYRTVCRVNQARSLDKQWQPPQATSAAPR